MVKAKIVNQLRRIYYDPTNIAGFSGARQLLKAFKDSKTHNKISENNILNWLDSQDTYTLHKPTRIHFKRRMYNVSGVDDVWEADLIDVRNISSFNNGYNYLLAVIDVLSKYAWIEPVSDKSCTTIRDAFKKILARGNGRIPHTLQTDRGKEFVGSPFQAFLQKNNISFRVVRNPDVKAAIVERFNRTIKEKIWRYFTYSRSKRYIDVLQAIVSAYNHTKHSATKFAPANVNNENAALAFENLVKRYGVKIKNNKQKKPKYACGDLVRISSNKAVFAKGYKGGWSKEIFRIDTVSTYREPIVYILCDLNGEKIDGIFYEEELIRVNQ